MCSNEEKFKENCKPSTGVPQDIPKVSKIVFDETTGTVTLTVASEEEIAEAEKMKKKSNEG